MRGMNIDIVEVVTALAATQQGVISAEQLDELGMTRSQIRTACRQGWLHVAAPRVYAIAGAAPSVQRTLWAGLLCLGPQAVVSHEAAATLHGFDRCLPDAVEFTMSRTSRGRDLPFRVHTTAVLPPLDRVTVDGFACTSATRTILDLARARIPTVRLEAAIDSAVRSGASAPIVIARRLEELRGPGRWGARRLDRLLIDSGGHSPLERRFLTLLRRAGLPRPMTQVVHRDGERTFARVDFCFDDLDVVVEVSGQKGHASPAERAKDAQRRNELQDVGRRVYEYTWRDVTERPGYVAHTMRERLRSAGWTAA